MDCTEDYPDDCTDDCTEELHANVPDLQYPSKQELIDAASMVIEFMKKLNWRKMGEKPPRLAITGGLAVMHHCPNRLPSIAHDGQEDIDIVLSGVDPGSIKSTLEDEFPEHFILDWQEIYYYLYIITPRGKVKVDFKWDIFLVSVNSR
ncbi:hypothetical protein BO78DRAFT_418669 [Aspergillus sclerotiicarbonarius CBS 121057]|uniref:Uncharacterized protein n=1 Tax=Aspergillus sclerotiicarbonarius (strain CBS 121057 / IBT 28362) TaxID=1448318 RepID=A0A319EIV2_ASPSB|nr:hypothetical protein BO78DRAFT_418669 [Aspergillus sclerotiicarbonarius CBS 121057]